MKQGLHTERKKLQDKKRDSPLSPGMQESVNLLPKYFRHQPQKGDRTKILYKDNQKNHLKKEILKSICSAFSQPLSKGFLHDLRYNVEVQF